MGIIVNFADQIVAGEFWAVPNPASDIRRTAPITNITETAIEFYNRKVDGDWISSAYGKIDRVTGALTAEGELRRKSSGWG
jgi:hypothetical protein